jgi:hypothetical protein
MPPPLRLVPQADHSYAAYPSRWFCYACMAFRVHCCTVGPRDEGVGLRRFTPSLAQRHLNYIEDLTVKRGPATVNQTING